MERRENSHSVATRESNKGEEIPKLEKESWGEELSKMVDEEVMTTLSKAKGGVCGKGRLRRG